MKHQQYLFKLLAIDIVKNGNIEDLESELKKRNVVTLEDEHGTWDFEYVLGCVQEEIDRELKIKKDAEYLLELTEGQTITNLDLGLETEYDCTDYFYNLYRTKRSILKNSSGLMINENEMYFLRENIFIIDGKYISLKTKHKICLPENVTDIEIKTNKNGQLDGIKIDNYGIISFEVSLFMF